MRKRVILFIAVFTALVFAEARPAFQAGDHNLGFGFAFGWSEGLGAAVAWDIGVSDIISIGVGVDWTQETETLGTWLLNLGERRNRYLTPVVRCAFHLFSIPKLAANESLSKHDIYFGARTGPRFRWWQTEHLGIVLQEGSGGSFVFDVMAGYRFHFSDAAHLWVETGGRRSVVGVGFKF